MSDLAPPCGLSIDQIDQIQAQMQLPPHLRRAANPPHDLTLLTALHQHFIGTYPYENLQLHYATNRTISIDPSTIAAKTARNGRGGYCVELMQLYAHLLRGLGLAVHIGGAKGRVRVDGVPQGDFTGWIHAVCIIALAEGQYVCDVGFGGDGPTAPMPLVDCVPQRNLGQQEVRLRHANIAGQAHAGSRFWLYEYRNGGAAAWTALYAFTEFEFVDADLEMVSAVASAHRIQKTHVLVVKHLWDAARGVHGKVMLSNGDVKIHEGEKTRVVLACKTEAERVRALQEWFGMSLTEEEKNGITTTRLA